MKSSSKNQPEMDKMDNNNSVNHGQNGPKNGNTNNGGVILIKCK